MVIGGKMFLEIDLYDYLSSDSELKTLLGATAGSSHIYPIQAQDVSLPYILYNMNDKGTDDEIILNANIQFNCIAETYLESDSIKRRVIELLDVEDGILNLLKDGYNRFYYSKLVGKINYKDPEFDIFYNVINFDLIYLEAKGFLLQENGAYLLQENGGYIQL